MRITYLYHSGFAIELEKYALLFDYYKGEIPDFGRDKAICVFASHSHRDHLNLAVLALAKKYENIQYFFGNDIKLNEKYSKRKGVDTTVRPLVSRMQPHESLCWSGVTVTTLRSNDTGVAFVVACEGKRFYHAGDLNHWHWEEESDAYNADMKKTYRAEIDRIAGQHFDVAFVALDPRLEGAYGYGMDYFLEKTDTDLVFPMHMWRRYEWIAKYKETQVGRKYADVICDHTVEGAKWRRS